jgi:hypothetical protein
MIASAEAGDMSLEPLKVGGLITRGFGGTRTYRFRHCQVTMGRESSLSLIDFLQCFAQIALIDIFARIG